LYLQTNNNKTNALHHEGRAVKRYPEKIMRVYTTTIKSNQIANLIILDNV